MGGYLPLFLSLCTHPSPTYPPSYPLLPTYPPLLPVLPLHPPPYFSLPPTSPFFPPSLSLSCSYLLLFPSPLSNYPPSYLLTPPLSHLSLSLLPSYPPSLLSLPPHINLPTTYLLTSPLLTSHQHAVLPGAPGSSQRGPGSDGTESGVVLHTEPRGVSSRVLAGRKRLWLMLFSSCICHTKAQQLIYILNHAD